MVDKMGKIKNFKLLNTIGGGCDEEVLRVVKMMPDWRAGRQNGRNVSVANMTIYADFKLK
jgi:protein TonB